MKVDVRIDILAASISQKWTEGASMLSLDSRVAQHQYILWGSLVHSLENKLFLWFFNQILIY